MDSPPDSFWLITGFQAMVFLWAWMSLVLIYGFFWRSLQRPEPDPIRPSGPFLRG